MPYQFDNNFYPFPNNYDPNNYGYYYPQPLPPQSLPPPPQNQAAYPNFQVLIPPPPTQSYQQFVPPHVLGPPPQQSRVLHDIQPNVQREQSQVKPPADLQHPSEDFDYATLLLAISDEYLDTAYASRDRSDEFYKLVATALGCLEAVLNNYKLQPLLEAQVSLKFAQVLYNETQNFDDAERILTRAIEVCERNSFVNLKYALQMLLAQVLHKSRPKAAMKDLVGLIEEAQAYKHVAWEYALRFLQVSFAATSNTSHDIHNSIHQCERIGAVARQNGDHTIFAFAALIEAFLHLKTPNPDNLNSVQRLLALARSVQLNPEVSENVQMQMMMEFLDLLCALHQFSFAQIEQKALEQKLKEMQKSLYQILAQPGWTEDGVVYIPLSRRSLNGVALQDQGVISERAGKPTLTFSWLSKADVEILGYLLSAVSVSYKNGADGGKAEKFVSEGLEALRSLRNDDATLLATSSRLPGYLARLGTLECHLILEKVFLLCSRGSWVKASEALSEFDQVSKGLANELSTEMYATAQYLEGIIQQGSGNLTAALEIFQSKLFSLSMSKDPSQSTAAKKPSRPPSGLHTNVHQSESLRSLSVLAALNKAFITHPPSHPQNSQLPQLLQTLEPLIHSGHNKHLQASYSLLLAVLSDNSILKQKQFLNNALQTAQSIGNAQIPGLTLALMQDKFFKGVVGEQAVKCAKAASHQARRVGDPLWQAVNLNMEGECLQVQGRFDEAIKVKSEAARVWKELPEAVKGTHG